MDGNLAATYTLIHAFLTKHSHFNVARALKKATKDLVVLKDDAKIDDPQLDEIIKEWRILTAKKRASYSLSPNSDTSSSTSDSNSEPKLARTTKALCLKAPKRSPPSSLSSSDSDSSQGTDTRNRLTKISTEKESKKSSSLSSQSDSSSDAETNAPTRDTKVLNKNVVSSPKFSSSNSETSSLESDDSASSKYGGSKKKVSKDKKPRILPSSDRASSPTLSSGSRPGHSSHSSSDHDIGGKTKNKSPTAKGYGKESKVTQTMKVKGRPSYPSTPSDSLDSSDSDSDSDSSSEIGVNTRMKKGQTGNKNNNTRSDRIPTSTVSKTSPLGNTKTVDVHNDDVRVTKKQKTTKNGDAIMTSVATGTQEEFSRKHGNSNQKGNTPFKRIDPDRIPTHAVKDNRYEVKAGPSNDYGQRAHQDLIVTRGAGFRKEKTKKKRGSYRGGEITMESHSFKFAD